MARPLLNLMAKITRELKGNSTSVHWQDVVSVGKEILTAEERTEAENMGMRTSAKWAVRVVPPDKNSLQYDFWRDGNLLNSEGARVARSMATVQDYDFQIKEQHKLRTRIDNHIAGLMRDRAALLGKANDSNDLS